MRALLQQPTFLVALVSLGAFACLTLAVAAGWTGRLDRNLVATLRPGDAWGQAQVRASPWMTRLEPARMYLLLGGWVLGASALRRSWRPLLLGVALAAGSMTATVATKLLVRRPDPHGWLAASGGSYPSGHVVAVLVCGAGCVLVASPRLRWWLWAPVALAFALMAQSLLVSAAHWPSDVAGGVLLSAALVGLAGSARAHALAQEVDQDRRAGAG